MQTLHLHLENLLYTITVLQNGAHIILPNKNS